MAYSIRAPKNVKGAPKSSKLSNMELARREIALKNRLATETEKDLAEAISDNGVVIKFDGDTEQREYRWWCGRVHRLIRAALASGRYFLWNDNWEERLRFTMQSVESLAMETLAHASVREHTILRDSAKPALFTRRVKAVLAAMDDSETEFVYNNDWFHRGRFTVCAVDVLRPIAKAA